MDELVRWLGEQLDAEEAEARLTADAFGAVWTTDDAMESVGSETGADVVSEPYAPRSFIAEHDPARVLREIEAKRKLLARWRELQDRIEGEPDEAKRGNLALTRHGLDMFVYQFGAVYADRTGYKESWRP
ncbi:DUF6221 family protein [Streptomyces canus]|uniref:DUF6221 family protein n=1 Tax=Streptomyces canus TaxID=58343 RepID=UPI0038643641|nr:DUF6221 family protein [Streptomyces canus]